MNINLILKEEIPILYENLFVMPIHKKLLEPQTQLNPNLAKRVFKKSAEEWYGDLKEYAKTLEDKTKREWINRVFLKKPLIEERCRFQRIKHLGWEDDTLNSNNGFVFSLYISRNGGGGLYFNKSDLNCETTIKLNSPNMCLKFSEEKLLEFGVEDDQHARLFIYGMHNVNSYPAALFLRNWAINYLNEAMKEI